MTIQSIVSAATRTIAKLLSVWRQVRATTQSVCESVYESVQEMAASIVETFSGAGASAEPLEDAPSKRIERRCVLVMSTNAHVMSMNVVAEKHQTLDALADMHIPVTLLVLDPDVHPLLFHQYRHTSKTARYPQIFLEDAATGDNRQYIQPETFQSITKYSLSPREALDREGVPMEQRASHVFRDVPKREIDKAHVLKPRAYVAPGTIIKAMEAVFEEREMAKPKPPTVMTAQAVAVTGERSICVCPSCSPREKPKKRAVGSFLRPTGRMEGF